MVGSRNKSLDFIRHSLTIKFRLDLDVVFVAKLSVEKSLVAGFAASVRVYGDFSPRYRRHLKWENYKKYFELDYINN